jgi:hypothetical protein
VSNRGLVDPVDRHRESALREASAGRRTMSYHDTWPMGSDQSRPVFHAAGC